MNEYRVNLKTNQTLRIPRAPHVAYDLSFKRALCIFKFFKPNLKTVVSFAFTKTRGFLNTNSSHSSLNPSILLIHPKTTKPNFEKTSTPLMSQILKLIAFELKKMNPNHSRGALSALKNACWYLLAQMKILCSGGLSRPKGDASNFEELLNEDHGLQLFSRVSQRQVQTSTELHFMERGTLWFLKARQWLNLNVSIGKNYNPTSPTSTPDLSSVSEPSFTAYVIKWVNN